MSSVRCEGVDGRATVSVTGLLPAPSGTIRTKGDVDWQQPAYHQHHQRHGRQQQHQRQQLEQQQQQRPYEAITLVDYRSGTSTALSSGEVERSSTPSTVTTISKQPRTTKGGVEGREALRQIHAQSSAETSGVGSDILQRIHALSSTETSGYGGDASLQSPIDLASPSSSDLHVQHHHRHQQHHLQQQQQPIGKDTGNCSDTYRQQHQHLTPSFNGSGRAVTTATRSADENGFAMSSAAAVGEGGHDGRCAGRTHDQQQRQHGRVGDAGASNGRHRSYEYRNDDGYYCGEEDELSDVSPTSRHKQRNGSAAPAARNHRNTDHSTDGRNASSRVGGGGGGSGGGTGASASGAGSAAMAISTEDGSDGQFLGRSTQSAWLRWSHERRASFRRRVEIAEQRQSELERYRVPSPVRKARQESARFVSAALEVHHQLLDGAAIAVGVSDDRHQPSRRRDLDGDGGPLDVGLGDVSCGHPAFPFDIPPPAVSGVIARKSGRKNGTTGGADPEKLTLAQWNALVAFWEHPVFARSRFIGLLFGFAALIIGVTGVVDNHWTNFYSEFNHIDCMLSNSNVVHLYRFC